MQTTITIPAELAGERLDTALTALTDLTRSQLQKQIKAGRVVLNGDPAVAKAMVQTDDTVIIEADAAPAPPSEVPDVPILYEDDDVLVINKPADLAVHPSETGRPQPTVAAFARAHGVTDEDEERPGIVHRLDKDTSGAMVIAKNPIVKIALQDQFKQRTVGKSYIALVRGRLTQSEAMINLPIGRDRTAPVKRAVVPGGREARTHYKVLETYDGSSLIEITLHTGRTHQIRVHMAHLGHPVIGDTLYGESKRPAGLTRQFLHAAELEFTLPDGTRKTVTAPLPSELELYLKTLRGQV